MYGGVLYVLKGWENVLYDIFPVQSRPKLFFHPINRRNMYEGDSFDRPKQTAIGSEQVVE